MRIQIQCRCVEMYARNVHQTLRFLSLDDELEKKLQLAQYSHVVII